MADVESEEASADELTEMAGDEPKVNGSPEPGEPAAFSPVAAPTPEPKSFGEPVSEDLDVDDFLSEDSAESEDQIEVNEERH